MNGSDMYDLIESHYNDIVADYTENPDELVDYMKDEEFQEYAQEWINNNLADMGDIALDAWKERDEDN